MSATASATTLEKLTSATRMPSLPFVKVADQEDMKLALMLNVIDPSIGGVLIMGERGTGKSVAVSLELLDWLFIQQLVSNLLLIIPNTTVTAKMLCAEWELVSRWTGAGHGGLAA